MLGNSILCARVRDQGTWARLRHILQPTLHDHHRRFGLHLPRRESPLGKVINKKNRFFFPF